MKRKMMFAVVGGCLAALLLFGGCSKEKRDETVSKAESDLSSVVSQGESMISEFTSDFHSNLTPESSASSDETAPTNAPLNAGAFDFSDISSLDNTLHGWGQGKEVNEQNRPVSCEQYEEKYTVVCNLPQMEGADYGDLAKQAVEKQKKQQKERGR